MKLFKERRLGKGKTKGIVEGIMKSTPYYDNTSYASFLSPGSAID